MTFTIPAGAMFFALGWMAGWLFLVGCTVAHAKPKVTPPELNTLYDSDGAILARGKRGSGS